MTTTNKPTNKNKSIDKSNGWVDEFNKSFDYSIIDSVIKGDVSDEDVWLEMKKNIIVHIQQLLDKTVKAELNRIVEIIKDKLVFPEPECRGEDSQDCENHNDPIFDILKSITTREN